MSAGLPAWADVLPPWTEPPPLEGDVTADVCVIGLGGTGLRAVTELRRHGLDTVGLDAGTVAGGAAGRNEIGRASCRERGESAGGGGSGGRECRCAQGRNTRVV